MVGEHVVDSALPGLGEGGGQQRQCARPAGDVGDDLVDDPRLERRPGPSRRELDRPAQLDVGHRPDQHVVAGHQLGQRRERRAVLQVVGTDGDDDHGVGPTSGSGEAIDVLELRSVVEARREQLFELIDEQQVATVEWWLPSIPARRRGRSRRARAFGVSIDVRQPPSAGSTPAASAGSSPARTSEDLPQPDAPTTVSTPATGEPGDELGDQSLTPEEVVGVAGLEGRQSLVRVAAHSGQGPRRRRCPSRGGVRPPLFEHVLDALHALGDLGAQCGQPGVDGRRAISGGTDVTAGAFLGPVAGQLVDPRGNAVGQFLEPVDVVGRTSHPARTSRRPAASPSDRGHPARGARRRRRAVWPPARSHRHRSGTWPPRAGVRRSTSRPDQRAPRRCRRQRGGRRRRRAAPAGHRSRWRAPA